MTANDLANETQRWLRYSREDLEAAEVMLVGEALVHALPAGWQQQSAEKAIKAALVSQGIHFPFRHDLDALRNLVPIGGESKRSFLTWLS